MKTILGLLAIVFYWILENIVPIVIIIFGLWFVNVLNDIRDNTERTKYILADIYYVERSSMQTLEQIYAETY